MNLKENERKQLEEDAHNCVILYRKLGDLITGENPNVILHVFAIVLGDVVERCNIPYEAIDEMVKIIKNKKQIEDRIRNTH